MRSEGFCGELLTWMWHRNKTFPDGTLRQPRKTGTPEYKWIKLHTLASFCDGEGFVLSLRVSSCLCRNSGEKVRQGSNV